MKVLFVSSTFRDMQLERDALQRISLPGINTEAKQYGDRVAMCDLRWGVNTSDMSEEDGNRKILDYCLDAIDRCEPVMIILLGERYGWIPGEEMIHSVSDRKEMQLEDYEISVTALEIEYGAFFRRARTLVYFRETEGLDSLTEAEDELHREKLAALKDKIRRLSGGELKTYKLTEENGEVRGIDDFADTVRADVVRLFGEEWRRYDSETPDGRERLIHRGMFSEDASAFTVGHGTLETLKNTVRRGGGVVNVIGSSGGGKSTLAGKLMEELEADGCDVLPIHVGGTAKCSTYNGALSYINAYFREVLGYTSDSDEYTDDVAEAFYDMDINDVSLAAVYRTFWNKADMSGQIEALDDYVAQHERRRRARKLVIIVDGMELFHTDRAEGEYVFIPHSITRMKNICMVLVSNEKIKHISYKYVLIPSFTGEENRKMIEKKLSETHRELDAGVMSAVLRRCEGRSPLYMNFLLKKLFMMDARDFSVMRDMKGVSARQLEVVESASSDICAISREVLTEAASRISREFLIYIMNCISLSREGLTEGELSVLWGADRFNRSDLYAFIAYMGDSFVLRENGRYDFANAEVKRGVLESIENRRIYAEAIVLALTDEFIKEELSSKRPEYSIVEEIAHIILRCCGADTLRRTVLKLWRASEMLRDLPEHVGGAEFCMEVLSLTLEDDPDRLMPMLLEIAREGLSADDGRARDALTVMDIFSEASTEMLASSEICDSYLELIERFPDTRGYITKAASVSTYAYHECAAEDSELAERYFMKALEYYISAISDITFSGDGDVIVPMARLIAENNGYGRYSEATNGRIEEILTECINTANAVMLYDGEEMDDGIRAYWTAVYLYCVYAHMKYSYDRPDPLSLLAEVEILGIILASSDDSAVEWFESFSGDGIESIYGIMADVSLRIARESPSKEYTELSLMLHKTHRELALADEGAARFDEYRYHAICAELYELGGEEYVAEMIGELQAILMLTEGGIDKLARRFAAADKLYLHTGDKRYAEIAVKLMRKIYAAYRADTEKLRYEDVLEDFLFLISEDPDGAEYTLDDSMYRANGLINDIKRALELCDKLISGGMRARALGRDELEGFYLEHLEYLDENYPESAKRHRSGD